MKSMCTLLHLCLLCSSKGLDIFLTANGYINVNFVSTANTYPEQSNWAGASNKGARPASENLTLSLLAIHDRPHGQIPPIPGAHIVPR